ncbi:MAG: hypothetical protein ACYC2K_11315 [Gemmatimonadales bacterium]
MITQVVVQIPDPPLPPLPPGFGVGGPPEEVLIAGVMIIGIIVAGIVFGPLIRAYARRIEGKGVDAQLAGEVDHLRARVAELESVQHRVAELEERVDFSERLLTQGRESQSVGRNPA